MKKILCIILCLVSVSLLFTACGKGNKNNGGDGEATKLTIYKARSSGMVDGKEIEMTVKVGDKVIAAKYSGTEIKLDGEEYTILRQADILAIVE